MQWTPSAPPLSASAQSVQDELRRRGSQATVVELPASTRSAAEAAEAIGCQVTEIAKSLVFRRLADDTPVLVLIGGTRRVDEGKLATAVGAAVGRADADFVRARVGFGIGGVPPVGHPTPVPTYIDRALGELETVWAAAGTPHAVFRTTPEELHALTDATVADLG
jgi:prolyl-tRNA editing enzyme YbaK/EbsC (Cys-tRNA(Pro) deacylase)